MNLHSIPSELRYPDITEEQKLVIMAFLHSYPKNIIYIHLDKEITYYSDFHQRRDFFRRESYRDWSNKLGISIFNWNRVTITNEDSSQFRRG